MIDKPFYKSVPTFRNYEDYRDAEQYTKGWNDAMDFIFPEAKKKERELESIKKKFNSIKAESENKGMYIACKKCKYNFDGECDFYDMGSGKETDMPCYREKELIKAANNFLQAFVGAESEVEPRWISCSKRLPNKNGTYLVTVEDCMGRGVEILNYANDLYEIDEYYFQNMKGIPGWYVFDGRDECFIDVDGVIAWAPLPEPFKENEK